MSMEISTGGRSVRVLVNWVGWHGDLDVWLAQRSKMHSWPGDFNMWKVAHSWSTGLTGLASYLVNCIDLLADIWLVNWADQHASSWFGALVVGW